MEVEGYIKSNKGFYFGDICYALSNDEYDRLWGGNGYEDGIFEDDRTGLRFAVAGTAHGDGEFADNYGNFYPVDGGNLGVVPLELVGPAEMHDIQEGGLGLIVEGAGNAYFKGEDGYFVFTPPAGTRDYEVDTDWADDEDEEYDEYDWPLPEEDEDEDYDYDYPDDDGDDDDEPKNPPEE